jgi:hypothetical protein
MYDANATSEDECVGYVFTPFTEMCYLKVSFVSTSPSRVADRNPVPSQTTWTPNSFTSTPANALSSGSVAVLLDFSCSSAAASGGKLRRLTGT